MTIDDVLAVCLADLNARFWRSVDRGEPEECWIWKKGLDLDRYGQITFHGLHFLSHRLAYLLTHGTLAEGMMICHTCDRRECCNPAHLYEGTAADNQRDVVVRNRRFRGPHLNTEAWARGDTHYARTRPHLLARGTRHGRATLNEEQVKAIRARYSLGGVTQRQLAREFDVSYSTINFLLSGRNWAHVE